jgi:hypothetical protein
MKKIFLALALVSLTAGSAAAHEEIPEVEIFLGYSTLKMGVSNNDIRSFQNEIYAWGVTWNNRDTSFFLNHGIAGSVAYNLNEYFSIVTDAKYNQGDLIKGSFEFFSPETLTDVQAPFVIGVKNVSALVGPRFSYRNLLGERVTVFGHALAGLDYWRLNCDFTLAGKKMGAAGDKFGPGIAIGGGVDVNVNEKFAIRVIQADYYMTRQMERWMNNANLSFGIVFRVGEKVLR